eukprot:529396_1
MGVTASRRQYMFLNLWDCSDRLGAWIRFLHWSMGKVTIYLIPILLLIFGGTADKKYDGIFDVYLVSVVGYMKEYVVNNLVEYVVDYLIWNIKRNYLYNRYKIWRKRQLMLEHIKECFIGYIVIIMMQLMYRIYKDILKAECSTNQTIKYEIKSSNFGLIF